MHVSLVAAFRGAQAAARCDRTTLPALEAAARALLAAAARDHHIEERAVVYLVMGPDGWEVDNPSDDGYPLEGYDKGALNEECECSGGEECEAVREAAGVVSLPTLPELHAAVSAYLAARR